jgi:hypothetical protein
VYRALTKDGLLALSNLFPNLLNLSEMTRRSDNYLEST